jgi:hypothetical protein
MEPRLAFRSSRKVFASPVLAVDALGISRQIELSNERNLVELRDKLDRHYHHFRATVPRRLSLVSRWGVWGTSEFETFRLNDMFVLFSRRHVQSQELRYLVSAALLFQTMLLDGFIPRGGLGFGPIIRGRNTLLGRGFLNAYKNCERRGSETKDICAIQVSHEFLMRISRSEKSFHLICFYNDAFFVRPYALIDAELGTFDHRRVLACLQQAGADEKKLSATSAFLSGLEDFDAAYALNSKSRAYSEKLLHEFRSPSE